MRTNAVKKNCGKRQRWGQVLRTKIRGREKQIVTERPEEEVRAEEMIITLR